MDDVTSRLNSLIKETKAYLEYASLSGLEFAPKSAAQNISPQSSLECPGCPFQSNREGPFRGWGGVSPMLSFVCATPPPFVGQEEYSPFTGKLGEQISKIISAAGEAGNLDDTALSLSFALRCLPPQDAECDALKKALRSCAPLLREEIQGLGPIVVVAMGAEACLALTGVSDIEASRGTFFDLDGIKIMPTYGINELISDRSLRRPIWADIQLALKALKG